MNTYANLTCHFPKVIYVSYYSNPVMLPFITIGNRQNNTPTIFPEIIFKYIITDHLFSDSYHETLH